MQKAALLSIFMTILASLGAGPSSVVVSAGAPQAPLAGTQGFIPVDGPSLRARFDAALVRAKTSGRAWVGYQFDLRPGLTIDVDWSRDGKKRTVTMDGDGLSVSTDDDAKTKNAGVLIAVNAGSVTEITLRDLDRRRDYGATPVYWIGRATTSESLDLLAPIASGKQNPVATERAIAAVGVHAGAEPGALLERIVRADGTREAREHAVTWLGIVGGHNAFIAGVVLDTNEREDMRKKAAIALGISDDPGAFATLRSLYGQVKDPEVRRELLTAVAIRDKKDGVDASTNFLIEIAEQDDDREVRKQALFWLSQRAGRRAADVLDRTAEDEREDIDVRRHALFAISQRDPDEAIPLLMKAARTSQTPEVRRQAMFWLAQIDDPRVLEFLKEVLQN